MLATMELFRSISSTELEQVASTMEERVFAPGDVLYSEGEPADALLFVVSGRVQVTSAGGDARQEVRSPAYPGTADLFGEMDVLSGDVRGATARALTESRVLLMHKDRLDELLARHPQLTRNLLQVSSRRVVSAKRELLSEIRVDDTSIDNGQVIAVFSPRGGSGKTALAVGLASRIAAQHPDRVALLDLNLLFENDMTVLDLAPPRFLSSLDVARLDSLDARALSEFTVRSPNGVRVLAAAEHPEDGERVTAAHVRATVSALKHQFQMTVIDCGQGFAEPMLAALEAADRVLVVCTPDMTTLRDARECQRLFGQVIHVTRKKLHYIFNHPLPVRGLTREQFESALEQPMALEIPHAGEALTTALENGSDFVAYVRAGNPFARALGALERDITPAGLWPTAQTATPSALARRQPGRGRLFGLLRAGSH